MADKKRVYIIIGCDTDADRPGFIEGVSTEATSWRGMLEGVPALKETLSGIKDSGNQNPIITWCLRVDNQILEIHGSYNAILSRHREFFLELENSGDELGWHPHFYRFDSNASKWYQEFKDRSWQKEMLTAAHREYTQIFPGRAKSVRMGWDYHNNDTFDTLERLGVEVDFSAMPGYKTVPKSDAVKAVNFYDWFDTPTHPYYATVEDYRRPAKPNETKRTMAEIPSFISKSFYWSLIKGLFFARKMKDYKQVLFAIQRPSYWINITGKPSLFAPLVRQLRREISINKTVFFATYFHPDELIENTSTLYSLSFMKENLTALLAVAASSGAEVTFLRAKDVPSHLITP